MANVRLSEITGGGSFNTGTDRVVVVRSSGTDLLTTITQNTGTVTSIGASAKSGIVVSGSPVTGSGVITYSLGNITPTTVNTGVVSATSLNVTGDVLAATGRVTASAATISALLTGATATFSGIVSANAGIKGTTAGFSGAISGSNLSGTNTGDQTITLTSDVSGSGTGSFATTINPGVVTPAKSNAAANTYTAGITVDGGGSAVTTGSKGFTQVNYNCTIANWTILADVSGTASMDVKRSTYAGFPTTTSIIGTGNAPILSGDRKQTAAPSGWTSVIVSAGDVLEFVVSAVATVTRLNLILQLTKN